MSEQSATAPIYVPGRTDRETQRLQQQGRMFEPFTRRLFEAAGLREGMKVLDVGNGAGDYAVLTLMVGAWIHRA